MSLDAALAYAAKEWPVFPCRPGDDFDPETGEVLPEKAPLISNGFRGATISERIIRELWKRNPGALVGIPTGSKIGAWVLDVDVPPKHEDGRPWLAAMQEQHGTLPETRMAETASGGLHYLFNHVDGVRNKSLGTGVETRGEGGFIVAPGSVMTDGHKYTWLNDNPIADAPAWLLELILPKKYEHHATDWQYTPGTNDRYVDRAMESELRELATTPPGNRGYQLNASAFAIGTLVGSGALSRSLAEAGLHEAAAACGVLAKDGERETWAKIRRGLDAGERKPRQIPELGGADTDNTRLVDISRMIANGLAKARGEPAAMYTNADTKPCSVQDSGHKEPAKEAASKAAEKPKKDAASKPSEDTEPAKEQATTEPSRTPDTQQLESFHATPFSWIDPKTLPPREFVFGTHYIRKYVSVTVSPGGLGKTSNSIVEALAMVTGDKFILRPKAFPKQRVWLFNAEDPRDEMERRIMAACIHYGLKPKDIEGHLFLDTGREQELVVAVDDRRTDVRIQVPVVEAVVEQIDRYGIDVMVVDPFVSTHQVNENDNGAVDKVAKLWANIADRTNCAIDVVHHLRKISDREATVEDARGAVALVGAARSVRVLNRMSEEQADKAGVPVEDRYSYFNIHQGKANLTKMAMGNDWRKLESVPLGNGRGLTKPQDHAGVVTAWQWPGAEEIKDGLTPGQLAHIKQLVDNGQYKEGNRAKDWAGKAIAYALGLDIEDDSDRKRCATILKALLKEGDLVKVEEKDPVRRETAEFVRSAGYGDA